MKKIYFIGINGIGMSGLAKIMKIKGYDVKGADLTRGYVTEELESMGITVYNTHEAEHVKDSDMVIASSAIKKDNPEYKYAMDNGIKIVKRGELLAMLLNDETGIAVAGTHGKTTTSSMMSTVMLEKDPTIVVGGILPEIGSNAKPGKSKYFIAEADESDNSFLYMNPIYSIITNIEEDHLDTHGCLENINKSFSQFMDQTEKEVIVCIDCENLKNVALGKNSNKIKTYSIKDKNADIYGGNIKVEDGKISYDVYIKGELAGNYTLSVPGNHNILNSLPVIYLAKKFGVEEEYLGKALTHFKGSKRRYDILFDDKELGIKVIDDYAHHPTEIKATLQGAKTIENEKITVIFQPHRYSRVKFLLNSFNDAFIGAEEVIILPIYAAGEKDEFGVTVEDLGKVLNNKKVTIEKNPEKVDERVLNCEGHEVFMFMGAGDISKIAHRIADKLEGKIR